MRPNDGRAIPNFIRQALRGDPLTVAGDGSQTRWICYVDDLVAGVLALADGEEPGPVNLGNPHELSMLDLARWVIELAGSSSTIEHVERPVDDPSVRRPDTTLARSRLGWNPQVPIEEGLLRTIAWFRQHPSWSSCTDRGRWSNGLKVACSRKRCGVGGGCTRGAMLAGHRGVRPRSRSSRRSPTRRTWCGGSVRSCRWSVAGEGRAVRARVHLARCTATRWCTRSRRPTGAT